MAKNDKKQEQIKYVDYQAVDTYIRNDSAYIGTVVKTKVDDEYKQFLIVSDKQSEVVDIIPINRSGQKISYDRPIVVLSNNDDESTYIPNGFYVGGERQVLIENNRDVTLDTFHDRYFGNTGVQLNSYEKQQVFQSALDQIDDSYKKSTYKEDLSEYLTSSIKKYYDYVYETRQQNNYTYNKNQYAQIGTVEQELQSILSDKSNDSFLSELKHDAAVIHQRNAEKQLQQTYEDSVDWGRSRFDRALSEEKLSDCMMRTRYYESSEQISEKFHNYIARVGLSDAIGKTDAKSYQQVTDTIQSEKDLLERSIARKEPIDVIEQRRDFIIGLSQLSATHPHIIQRGTLSDADVSDARRGYSYYSFMPNNNYHAVVSEHRGAQSGCASEPLSHTDRMYQNMGQQDFYQYLVAKSKIVQEIIRKTDFGVPKATNEYQNILNGNTQGADVPITQRDRLDYIGNMLKDRLGFQTNDGIDKFLKSDEFATIIRSPESLLVKKDNAYLTYVDGELMKTEKISDAMRPEYGTDISRFDIHSKQSCEELLASIKKQMQFDSVLHERPSQELREIVNFVQDHIKYNETVKTAEFNSRIAFGLDFEPIRYNEMTQRVLNDVGSFNVRESLRLLNDAGIIDVDFSKKPTAYQIIHNYESLSQAEKKVDDLALNFAQRVASNLKGSKIDKSAEEIYNNISKNIDSIKSTADVSKKANLILETLSIKHNGHLTRSDIAEVTKFGNIVEMEGILHFKDVASNLQTLTFAMKDAPVSGISYLRGCDSFVHDTNGVIAQSKLSANDIIVANKLDIASAINRNPSKNPYDMAIDVIENQSIRNDLINQLQKSVSYSENQTQSDERKEIFENLKTLSGQMLDVESKIGREERATQIASTFKIQLSENLNVKDTQVALLNSSEFLSAIQYLRERTVKENFATTVSDYNMLSLEKCSSIDAYKQLIEDLRTTNKYDITMIGDTRYISYIKEDMLRSGLSENPIISHIDQIKQEDTYTKLLITCRNIEDLTHNSVLTNDETKVLKKIGSDIAFQCAMQDIGRDNSISAETSYLVKNNVYQKMIDAATDANNKSSYMEQKIQFSSDAIASSAKTLVEKLDIVWKDSNNITAGFSVPLRDGIPSSRHQFHAHEVIRSDKSAEVLKEDMSRVLQQNKNYAAYMENNNHGETMRRIEQTEKELQFKRECEKTAVYMIDEYHSKANGIHAKKYSKCEACEISRLETIRLEIEALNQKKSMLEDSIRNTYGNVHKDLINEQRMFHNTFSADSAMTYAEKMLKIYSPDPIERNAYRYPDQTSGKVYECLRLCENLESTNLPMSIRKDSYIVRETLAREAQEHCINEARNICNKRIADIATAFQPGANTQITPAVIQAAIETSSAKMESSSPIEKIGLRNEISKYSEMRDELITISSIIEDLKSSDVNKALMSMAAKLNVSTYHISEQYSSASQYLKNAQEDKRELEKFEAAREAYIAIDQISERTSHMSYRERDIAATNAFPNHKIISRNELVENILKSENPIANSPQMTNYLQARTELEAGKTSVKILREKLSAYQAGDSNLDLNDDDRRALIKIQNYNQAINQLKPFASEVRALSLEISGTKAGTKIIANEMYTPIDIPNIDKHVQQYIIDEKPKTLVETYKSMTEERKLEITNNVINAIQNTDYKHPDVWPNENAKIALLSMSEKGIDKTLSGIGDEIAAMSEANNVIEFYKRNVRNLANDNDLESKQILRECEKLSASVAEEQDSKHQIVLKALEDAKNTQDEYSV